MEASIGMKLTKEDAERLVQEALENPGEGAMRKSRPEQIQEVRRVLQRGVKSIREEEATETLGNAAWASVKARRELRESSRRDLRHFVRRILRVEGVAELPLRGISSKECRRILKAAFADSRSSYIKGRAVLSSIFSYGLMQEWCSENPVQRIEVPKTEEKTIEPLSTDEVERLLKTAQKPQHRCMAFSLRLMLYCGIRPTEVKRLKESDIYKEEGIVIIRPNSSKTGGGRTVTLRGMQGLKAHELQIPRNWNRRWRALRRDAGFTHWTADVCRHTFASYHAARFRNLPELQLEMGHRDSSLLRTRYMVPVSKTEAEKFWEMRPIAPERRGRKHRILHNSRENDGDYFSPGFLEEPMGVQESSSSSEEAPPAGGFLSPMGL